MDTSNYNLLAAQIANFNKLTAAANDVSNVNTNGYKRDKVTFNKYLSKDLNDINTMPIDSATFVDATDGDMKKTDRELDIAIQGPALFTISTPLGIRYTKSGHFFLNNNSELVTATGDHVLSDAGDIIAFDPQDKIIMFDGKGTILVKSSEAAPYEERGMLGISSLSDMRALRKAGDNYFTVEDGFEIIQPDQSSYKVMQGFIEQSNISSVQAMTNLLEIQQNNNQIIALSKNMPEQNRLYNILSKGEK